VAQFWSLGGISTMTESEHVRLICGSLVGLWALGCALIAWRVGRNPFLWFFIGLVPIIGQFAVLYFILIPAGSSLSKSTTTQQTAESSRKFLSPRECRIAFALVCYVFGFAYLYGHCRTAMPTWLSWLVYILYIIGFPVLYRLSRKIIAHFVSRRRRHRQGSDAA
jgi:hypothetical protein